MNQLKKKVTWKSLLNRERVGWIFYDWANSAYVLCVITAIGGPYLISQFNKSAELAGNLKLGDAPAISFAGLIFSGEVIWSFIISASALFVALSSAFLGAIADRGGSKKRFLEMYCLLGVICTVGLSLELPWWVIGALILVGNIGFEGGNVFYNAFLPDIAEGKEQDLLSSAGFSLGYLGSTIALIAILLFFIPPGGSIYNAFLLVGIWWGGFALITFSLLRERPSRQSPGGGRSKPAWQEVYDTIKGIGRYPQAALFLGAFLLYNDGIATIISNASPFASENIYQDLTLSEKIRQSQLIFGIILVQIIGIPATLFFGRMATIFGEKKVIYITLIIFSGIVTYGQVVQVVTDFYILAGMIGLVLGGSQAISRSLFSSLIPNNKHAEFFGFFAISSKFSAFAGPLIYGTLLMLTGNPRWALLSLLVFFIAGGIVLYFVDVNKGRRDAGKSYNY